jgi:hypothetical protein
MTVSREASIFSLAQLGSGLSGDLSHLPQQDFFRQRAAIQPYLTQNKQTKPTAPLFRAKGAGDAKLF